MPALRLVVASTVLAALLAACSSGGPIRWRGLEVTPPEGWVVHEDTPTAFAITDEPLGTEEESGKGEVGVFFQYSPDDSTGAWRELAEAEGWEIETDRDLTIGQLPASQLVFRHDSIGIPTREMVVRVPSRGVTILLQPVVRNGQTDGPEVYLEHLDEFQAILDSIVFGAPVDAGAAPAVLRWR